MLFGSLSAALASENATPALRRPVPRALALCGLLCVSGCDSVLGLSEFSVRDMADAGSATNSCTSNRDCRADNSGLAGDADHCVTARRRCAALESADCRVVTGPTQADDAILIGSLLSVAGAPANLARQQSAVLAVEEINAAGGVPSGPDTARPLLMVSCDAKADAMRAATHLFDELRVPAVVGPDSTQDPVSLATKLAIPNGALMLSPTLGPASAADLVDDDLIWSLVPNDLQRAALMIDQVHGLETALQAQRAKPALKLGILAARGPIGASAVASLSTLMFGDEPLSHPHNLGDHVRIDSYAVTGAPANGLVADYAVFAPDIVVLLGAQEAVAQWIAPLENAWLSSERPAYLLTDAAKGPELLELLKLRADLAARVRGVGVTAASVSLEAQAAFTRAYQTRFGDPSALPADLSACYDAVYAIALAAAAQGSVAISGRGIAAGLRRLMGGDVSIELGSRTFGSAAQSLAAGENLSVVGTLTPLLWDERGALSTGTLDSWCIADASGSPSFGSGGRQLDVASQELSGVFAPCDHTAAADSALRSDMPGAMPDAGAAPDAAASAGASDAGSHDAGSKPPDPTPSDAGSKTSTKPIACGALTCDVSRNESCCVSMLRVPPDSPQPGDFSCATGNASCAASFHCTSDAHCGSGRVCCGVGSAAKCVATSACAAMGGTHLGCASARDCAGMVCCGRLMPASASFSSIECSADCPGLGTSYQLCMLDDDCVTPLGTRVCRASPVLPALKVCQAF
jgi:ABC-type branched-subunit amino acid transport system substrate-binding protein